MQKTRATLNATDEVVVQRLKRAVELAAERATESLSLLRMLAEDVGIGDTEYCSPEELVRRVAEFSDAEVPRVPDGSGWWWHGERVVEVEADYEGSPGRMNGPGILVVVRANGRRTPLAEMPDWWGGPARRDARCPVPPSDDEDAIPF
jgi:hypothetical protein